MDTNADKHEPPASAVLMIRSLLPEAERAEVESDIRDEYRMRFERDGEAEANAWVWRQARGSASPLMRRSWWRGWNGFESEGNRNKPGGAMLELWIQDARFAVRRLWKRPLFAVLAILTLALGVGGTAAVYSLVRTLLLSPLPYAHPESIATFWAPYDWSMSEYYFLQDNHPGFEDIAAYYSTNYTLTAKDGSSVSARTVVSSPNLLDVLGTKPMLGRGLQPGDEKPGAPSVVVLSYGLWRDLGSDPTIVGKTIHFAGDANTVLGVMPRGFWFPDPTVRLWANLPFNPLNRSGNFAMIGRLAPGKTFEQMKQPLQLLAAQLKQQYNYPDQWDKSRNPVLTPVRDAFAGTIKPVLLATLAAMALILLIACSNVAALMLGQVDSRSTELAVRSALGANRRQLLQQLVIETLVLGLGAGVIGSMIAAAGFNMLAHSLPLGALMGNATLSWSVFTGAIVISILAALLVAAAPVISVWRGDLRDSLTRARTGGIGARGGITEGALVVIEVALAVLLVAGAALLIRTVSNLKSINAGINVKNVAVLDIVHDAATPRVDRLRLHREIIPAIEGLPGVQSAASTMKLPLTGSGNNWGFALLDNATPPAQQATTAFRGVSPGYLSTIGMNIIEGRDFTSADLTSGDTVVVINDATRAKFFGTTDPIGRRVTSGSGGTATVIGVVSNAAEANLTDGPTPARYMLADQIPYTPLEQTVVVRVKPGVDPASVLDAVRHTLQRVAPSVAIQRATTMQAIFDAAVGPALQMMGLLIILGVLALTLGAIGVYGVVSHFVTKRRREWSIRLALGLRPSALVAQIVTRGGSLVALGACVGMIAAIGMMRVLVTLLYNVKPADSLSLLGASAALLLAGMIAALIPAWRASRVDPASVLREQ